MKDLLNCLFPKTPTSFFKLSGSSPPKMKKKVIQGLPSTLLTDRCYCLPKVRTQLLRFLVSLRLAWKIKQWILTNKKSKKKRQRRTIILKVFHFSCLIFILFFIKISFFRRICLWILLKVSDVAWPDPTCIPHPSRVDTGVSEKIKSCAT